MDPRANFPENVVRDAMAEWLLNFDWDWYGTWTFRRPMYHGALKYVERSLSRFCKGRFDALAYLGEECHRDGERLHVHGLVRARGIDPKAVWKSWYDSFGRNTFVPVRTDRSAVARYVSKYITKDMVRDWNITDFST